MFSIPLSGLRFFLWLFGELFHLWYCFMPSLTCIYRGIGKKLSAGCLVSGLGIVLLLSACATKPPDFAYPVKPPWNVSRQFSLYHEGVDFPKGTGHPVLATADGTVIYTGSRFRSYGKVIIIEHEKKWASLYAHLSKIGVQRGSFVRKRQKIGEVGNTGRSLGPHLHFELMYEKQPVNPLSYIKN